MSQVGSPLQAKKAQTFLGIRLVERTEQKFRRILVCFIEKKQKKRVTSTVGLFYYIKAPIKREISKKVSF